MGLKNLLSNTRIVYPNQDNITISRQKMIPSALFSPIYILPKGRVPVYRDI